MRADLVVVALLLAMAIASCGKEEPSARYESHSRGMDNQLQCQETTDMGGAVWAEGMRLGMRTKREVTMRPRLVVDCDDNVHAVWSIENKIMYRRGQGREWTEVEDISLTERKVFETDWPSICTPPQGGGVHVVWGRLGGISYKCCGNTWWSPEDVIDIGRTPWDLVVCWSRKGLIIFWHQYDARAGRDELMYVLQSERGWTGPARVPGAVNTSVFDVVADPMGNIHLVWVERHVPVHYKYRTGSEPPAFSLCYSRYDAVTLSWAEREELVKELVKLKYREEEFHPAIAVDRRGEVCIAWVEDWDGRLYLRRRNGAGWQDPMCLAIVPPRTCWPAVAYSDKVGLIVACGGERSGLQCWVLGTTQGSEIPEFIAPLSGGFGDLQMALSPDGTIHFLYRSRGAIEYTTLRLPPMR